MDDIAQRIARLAHISDDGELSDYRDLYAEDATWHYTGDPVRGVDAIIANGQVGRDNGRVGPGSGVRHSVTTIAVTPTGEGAAESDAYVLVYNTVGALPELRSIVKYHDTWEHRAEGWRLRARVITKA